VEPDSTLYSFVHALTRQAVIDRMPLSRRTLLHARAAEALERQPPHSSLVPRLAQHYLAAQILGFQDRALHYSREAGQLAERSLAFEDAAGWFERAAGLRDCDPAVRCELLLAAGDNYVRACRFPHARTIYESLATTLDPAVRLAAAIGFENASWQPGVVNRRAADFLSSALETCGLDQHHPRYVRALGSLARALALAGETSRARQVSARAIHVARQLGAEDAITHAVSTSFWHGTTPDVADLQFERTTEVHELAKTRRDFEALGSAANFRAMVSYLLGRPEELADAISDQRRAAEATGQPYYRYVYSCLAHADAFIRGDFAAAERWAEETVNHIDALGDEITEGPHAVQMFMIRRETGTLGRIRSYLDGSEALDGRWVPGLLALYTELGMQAGIRRALDHLMDRDLRACWDQAQWPMELVFMIEGALKLEDRDSLRVLLPFLTQHAGMNLLSGTLIATFGSADRLLGRVAAALGDHVGAERHFVAALAMDRKMRSTLHVAETLAQHAHFLAQGRHQDRARVLASEARELAGSIGAGRVLAILGELAELAELAQLERAAPSEHSDGLTDRELEILRLLAGGLSNQEIGARLHISANTAANHVRSILMKTGAANRTQAAMYAAQRQLV
jgi:DNA-binding CsgD family transcriptional regulator